MEIPLATKEKLSRPAISNSNQPRSEWEEILDRFLLQLNPGREQDGFKPYTHARLASILKKAGVNDTSAAYLLFRRCQDANSFSRLFAYLTKA